MLIKVGDGFVVLLLGLVAAKKLYKMSLCLIVAFFSQSALSERSSTSLFSHADSKWLKPYRFDGEELPYFPSRIITVPGKIGFDDFDSSKICAGCHVEIYQEWQQSVMAHAWKDPIYRALLQKASTATGGKVDKFCIGCHSPIGMVTNSIGNIREDHIPGVDCETCHSIANRTGLDNGAFVLHKAGKNIKRGPRRNAESPFHQTEYSSLHTRSDFCAVCHNVTHPFNGAAIERTYDEWLESPYSELGVHCQDCHMGTASNSTGPLTKSAVMGRTRDRVAGHRFIGANAALMAHLGFAETAMRSIELLRSAATIIPVSKPEAVSPGDMVRLTYKVQNVGAGHKLPTGFPEGREMWVDLKVTDGAGREVFRSGAIKNGRTEAGTRSFKATMGDKEGKVVDINVWEVDRVLADTRIPALGYAEVDYVFRVPESSRGLLKLKADLKYWPFSQYMADHLLGEGVMDVMVVVMASSTFEIFIKGE